MRFGGIDPGLYGARVVIDSSGRVVGYAEPPLASKFHQTDPASRFDLRAWARDMKSADMKSDYTAMESPSHWGHGGQSGWWTVSLLTFTYGMWAGLCQAGQRKGGVLVTVGPKMWKAEMVPGIWAQEYIEVQNPVLKKLVGVKRKKAELGKRLAIARAMEFCATTTPVDPFRQVLANTSPFERQHGRAEAYLLALYCRGLRARGGLG